MLVSLLTPYHNDRKVGKASSEMLTKIRETVPVAGSKSQAQVYCCIFHLRSIFCVFSSVVHVSNSVAWALVWMISKMKAILTLVNCKLQAMSSRGWTYRKPEILAWVKRSHEQLGIGKSIERHICFSFTCLMPVFAFSSVLVHEICKMNCWQEFVDAMLPSLATSSLLAMVIVVFWRGY